MRSLLLGLVSLSVSLVGVQAAKLPAKIYGVNLGSWLLIEPWMLPGEWLAMGGQQCSDCSKCIASEFAFAKAYPNDVDRKFNDHWNSWFAQSDVNQLKDLGINTVRIPLGYWLIEDLVDRATEYYPRGGIVQLRRGLQQLANAGIVAILDHHGLPGVQSPQQQFTGRCTTDIQFYTQKNYHRALIWTAVLTGLSHADPAFANAVALQAINEPIQDATKTPGHGEFQKNYVLTVRAVEYLLGFAVPSLNLPAKTVNTRPGFDIAAALSADLPSVFPQEVKNVVKEAAPIIGRLGPKLGLTFGITVVEPLITNFMDVSWQWNNPANPADAARGPQVYDNHLYYSFGGVADPNENAYLTHICNLDRVDQAIRNRNIPLYFGEWALSTNFGASDAFLKKWADAQKRAYSRDAGWVFWNFKIEISSQAGDTARQWSYVEGVRRGYLTRDPSKLNDPNVCAPYIRR